MSENVTETLTLADFARLQGWNRSVVTRLKHAGRLVMRDGGVDVQASLRLLAETADPRRSDVAARHAQARLQKTEKSGLQGPIGGQDSVTPAPTSDRPAGAQSAASAAPLGVGGFDAGEQHGLTFQAARAKKEHYLALQAEAEYGRTIGALLPRADVVAALDDLVALMRQALDTFPTAAAPRLLGQDIDAIRATLREDLGALVAELRAEAKRQLAALQNEQLLGEHSA